MSYTLRNEIKKSKALYIKRYGALDWRWYDEGVLYTIMDYESSIGLEDFTADDWAAAEENGWDREHVEFLCSGD